MPHTYETSERRGFEKDPRDTLIEAMLKKMDWIERNMRMSPHSSPFAICDLKDINKEIQAAEKAIKGG